MWKRTIIVACVLIVISSVAWAQMTTAGLSGTVTDETGGLLPGVEITVTNVDTGRTRSVVSDDEGRYIAPELTLGAYEVEASLAGFQTSVRSGIQLTLGRQAVVDLTLQIGEITERVTVTGEAPLVETTQSTLADLVEERIIRDLPLNGRNFPELALLQAGAMVRNGQTNSSFSPIGGGGTKISIGGARPKQNAYVFDGQDAKDAFGNAPGSAAGTVLGVETVRELSVLSNTYSSEFGGAGGVILAVTKSGTNSLHGSIFWFHRNDNLDARNFFDPGAPPEFKRNQYGFTVGGPIIQDRTFFFGSYEGLRERLGATQIRDVPSLSARAGTVDPIIQPYLDLYPLPNGRDNGDGTAEFLLAAPRPTDEDYFLIKIDHSFSDSDSIEARYFFDDAVQNSYYSGGIDPQFRREASTRRQLLNVAWRRIVSPTLINVARVSFNRSYGGLPNIVVGDIDPSLNFLPDRLFGQLQVSGLSTYGTDAAGGGDRLSILNSFEYGDTVNLTKGRHSLKFGGVAQRLQLNGLSGSRLHGRYVFTSVANFLSNNPNRFEFLDPRTGGSSIRGFRGWLFSLFVQDDFQFRPNLTMNLGLRYELSTAPKEVGNRIANVRNLVTDTAPTIGDPFFKKDPTDFGPRIGVAWDPTGSGNTSIRSGFGIFYQQHTHANWWLPAYQNAPFFVRPIQRPTTFPTGYDDFLASPTSSFPTMAPFQYEPSTPYMMQYHLTIQQQLASDTVLSVSYAGSAGRHLGRLFSANTNQFEICPACSSPIANDVPAGTKYFPEDATKINPNFGDQEVRQWDTNSSYNALQLRVTKRFSQGFAFQGAYTFSRTLDQASGIAGSDVAGSGAAAQDPFDQKSSKGLSGFHVQNRLSMNFSADVPSGDYQGVAGAILGGWKVNGIITVADGNSVNILNNAAVDRARMGISRPTDERPNLKPGADNNPVLGGPDKYFDSSPFELQEEGFFGNLGRNTAIGPGFANVDFSVLKDFALNEDRTIQFRAEFFNLFNRANFSNPSGTVFSNSSGNPSGSFGRIRSTSTTSRQIQFALKFLF